MKLNTRRLALMLVVVSLYPSVSFGYVDPGSGYMLLQLGVSFLVGSLFFLPRTLGRAWRYLIAKRKSSHL